MQWYREQEVKRRENSIQLNYIMQYETDKAVKFQYKTTQKTLNESFLTTMIINEDVTYYKFIKSFSL